MREMEALIRDYPIEELLGNRERVLNLALRTDIPSSMLMDYLVSFSENLPKSENIKSIEKYLSEKITYQVLYLPTYRRIEQDLGSDISWDQLRNFRDRIRARISHRPEKTGFVELVEFGMEDVEETIKRKMADVKDNVRNGLNNLTGRSLRDVIQGIYKSADLFPKLSELDEPTINAIFSRIPQAILPEHEQNSLRAIITKIKATGSLEDVDKVVAHFLTQLLDLHKDQQENEKDVREFIKVCNGYFNGQRVSI